MRKPLSLKDPLNRFAVIKENKPLVIGVHLQFLKATHLSPEQIAKLLADHVNSRAYLESVAAGGSRFNLDGTVAGEISAKHQAYSKARLEET
jgi:ProP effector